MKIKIRKSLVIFLIVISTIVISLVVFPKTIYKVYNKLTFEECTNLNSNDVIILNNFFEWSYNWDIKYWCKIRKISPRFLHDKNLEIPKELWKLINLKFIDLSWKRLSWKIPKELWNLDKLKSLLLNDNNLSWKIPKELWQLQNLKVINLSENKLIPDIPKELQELQNKWKLDSFRY